ncbi:MAG: hypothetical protein ACLTTW_04870 [Coprobacter sp.]
MNQENREVCLVPVGGLANRMRAIVSVLNACQKAGVKLKIVWFRNRELNAPFYSLFNPLRSLNVTVKEAAQIDFLRYYRPVKKNLWLSKYYLRSHFDKVLSMTDCIPIVRDEQNLVNLISNRAFIYRIFADMGSYRNIREIMSPNRRLSRRIDDFVAEHFGEHTIGVHVRRTDNSKAIQCSPLELFIKAIGHELEIDGNVRFFVASDSDEVKQELLNRFGDRIITVFESCDRNSRQGIENGLTDLYLLSRTCKIYGCVGSSFTEVAALIGNIELIVLSI